jgi:hypothetical protein
MPRFKGAAEQSFNLVIYRVCCPQASTEAQKAPAFPLAGAVSLSGAPTTALQPGRLFVYGTSFRLEPLYATASVIIRENVSSRVGYHLNSLKRPDDPVITPEQLRFAQAAAERESMALGWTFCPARYTRVLFVLNGRRGAAHRS